MQMPSRNYSSDKYRYGFNGKEKDKDLNSLTAYDYGFRIYNPAIGKFLSVDPLSQKYPWYTPYQFAGNTPIRATDLDGAEPTYFSKDFPTLKSFYDVYIGLYKKGWAQEDALRAPDQFSIANITIMKALFLYNYYARTISCNGGYCDAHGSPPYPGSITILDERKYGWYDCITSIIAGLQYLYGNFDKSFIPRSASKFGENLVKKGLADKPFEINFYKNGKDIADNNKWKTPKAIPDGTNFSEVLRKDINNKEGSNMYLITYFGGWHTALVEVSVDREKKVTITLMDETSRTAGQKKFFSFDEFNKYMVEYAATALDKHDQEGRATGNPDTSMSTTTKVYKLKPKEK